MDHEALMDAERRLADAFRRGGYFRVADPKRREQEPSSYKKGAEARFIARSERELGEIRAALRASNFRIAQPFQKGRRIIQPVYGQASVLRIVRILNRHRESQGAV